MKSKTIKIIRVICIITFVVSLAVLGNYLIGDLKDQHTNDDVNKLKDNGVTVPDILDEYAGLYAENGDTIGWLKVDGTEIDNVVMYAPDELQKYLRRDFYGNDSRGGCLFVDEFCTVPDSDNIIIYGHNMKNGTMFGTLDRYADKSFYSEHKFIQFDTIYEKHKYEVVAAIKTQIPASSEDCFRYYEYTGVNDEEMFIEYVQFIEENRLYDTGIELEPGDKLLTLSTCSYHTSDGRFIVVARQVD